MNWRTNADSSGMNRRTEARFQVHSTAQLILLNDPERELKVSLTDVSGGGFQLLVDEVLQSGTKIVVETDAHMILAEVRHSRRRGERYAVGAQRVHTLPKFDLPDDASRLEKVQLLINDYQLKMRKESSVPTPEPPPVIEVVEEVVDVFEPRWSATFHAIPQVSKPALPKLASPRAAAR